MIKLIAIFMMIVGAWRVLINPGPTDMVKNWGWAVDLGLLLFGVLLLVVDHVLRIQRVKHGIVDTDLDD